MIATTYILSSAEKQNNSVSPHWSDVGVHCRVINFSLLPPSSRTDLVRPLGEMVVNAVTLSIEYNCRLDNGKCFGNYIIWPIFVLAQLEPGKISRTQRELEMLLIPNALCWSSRKCNCACALPTEVQLRVTRRRWQKLFAGKNFVKILVTAQTQLRSYSEQQRAFGNSNICNCVDSYTRWCMHAVSRL